MSDEIIPIFYTHYSKGGRSILTADKAEDEFPTENSISIFDIAKKHDLTKLYVVDDNFSGFYRTYSNAEKYNIDLRWGLELRVCQNIEANLDEDLTESKVIIFILNNDGYKDLLKLNTFANTTGYNFNKKYPRIDWKSLNEYLTDNLLLCIPFYSGFLYKNLFKFGAKCCPLLPKNCVFLIGEQGFPLDGLLKNATIEYCNNNEFSYCYSHNIYYYEEKDVEALQVYRCIHNGSTLDKPELKHFCSDQFSYKSYIEKINK